MNRIKVMIIDDEKRTREGLKQAINWEEFGLEFLCEAEDSLHALALASELSPELILCDIRLPDLDGLEFANRILAILPSVKMIFITGYSSPEYMKQAIRLEALDFIEKPVDLGELESAIRRAARIIRSEQRQRASLNHLRDRVQLSKAVVSAQLFEDLCAPIAGERLLLDKLRVADISLPLSAHYRTIVCRLAAPVTPPQARTICDRANAVMDHYGMQGITGTVRGQYLAAHIRDEDGESEKLYVCFYQELRPPDSNICAGAVGPRVDALSKVGLSFAEACPLADREAFFSRRELLFQDTLEAGKSGSFQRTGELTPLFKAGDGAACRSCCKTIFQQLQGERQLSLEEVLAVLSRMLELLRTAFLENGVPLYTVPADAEEFPAFLLSMGFAGFQSWYFEQLELLFTQSASGQQASSLLLQIQQYLDQNYSDPNLSLQKIAEALYLSPSYLSFFFKKSRGVSLNRYLTELRIGKAKELLKRREYKLYEISQMVGFQDENYFSKVFKKSTGMTPMKYRDLK